MTDGGRPGLPVPVASQRGTTPAELSQAIPAGEKQPVNLLRGLLVQGLENPQRRGFISHLSLVRWILAWCMFSANFSFESICIFKFEASVLQTARAGGSFVCPPGHFQPFSLVSLSHLRSESRSVFWAWVSHFLSCSGPVGSDSHSRKMDVCGLSLPTSSDMCKLSFLLSPPTLPTLTHKYLKYFLYVS